MEKIYDERVLPLIGPILNKEDPKNWGFFFCIEERGVFVASFLFLKKIINVVGITLRIEPNKPRSNFKKWS